MTSVVTRAELDENPELYPDDKAVLGACEAESE